MADRKPIDQVRGELKIPWYRSPVEPAVLRQLTKRSDAKGMAQAVGNLLLVAATGVLTYYLFNQRLWILFTLSLFAHGTFYCFLDSATHELSHGTVFKTKRLNGFFLRLISLIRWVNFHTVKMSHMYHHLYTLHPDGDGEIQLPKNPSLRALFLFQMFTFRFDAFIGHVRDTARLIFVGRFRNEWIQTIYADQEVARRKAINWARILVLFHAALIAASIILKLWLLPVLVTLAPWIAYWGRYFVGLPMHCGLRDNIPDFRKCVRTIKLGPIFKFVYWRMNYHTEHHMYGAVPFYNLRRLQKVISFDMPAPQTLIGAWRQMRVIWHKQEVDPSYQFDTQVPNHDPVGASKQDELSSSIGPIAPSTFVR
jgi:fatty acid desaturase